MQSYTRMNSEEHIVIKLIKLFIGIAAGITLFSITLREALDNDFKYSFTNEMYYYMTLQRFMSAAIVIVICILATELIRYYANRPSKKQG